MGGAAFGEEVAWYENDGGQNFTPHIISTAASSVSGVFAADVDGDGDMDVLSASQLDNMIAWYENDGNQNFTDRTISTNANLAFAVFAADVDGDGDMDALSASRGDDKIAWYENDGNENFTDHTISTNADGAAYVFATDVDGDGDVDVLSASFSDHEIMWYENDGSQNFTEHTITSTALSATGVFAADVDGDGDLDVLSASRADDKIAWYAQNQAPIFTSPTAASVSENTQSVFLLTGDDGDLPSQPITFTIDGSTADNDLFEIIGGDQLQFIVAPDFENPIDVGGTAGDNVYEVSVLADDGIGGLTSQTIMVTVTDLATSVTERNIFYNDSNFDGGSNVDAIAPDKMPLLNGQVATFANYTSYSKGINGIIINVTDLNQEPTLATAADFLDFRVGNNNTPGSWASATAPTGLDFDQNVDGFGTDQITLTWADNTIEKIWLQVNVLANANTGLSSSDTFYFGNAVGESGNDPANAIVNPIDIAAARLNQTGFGSADIDNVYDFNRDGKVNPIDIAIARTNQSGFTPLKLIDLTGESKGFFADGTKGIDSNWKTPVNQPAWFSSNLESNPADPKSKARYALSDQKLQVTHSIDTDELTLVGIGLDSYNVSQWKDADLHRSEEISLKRKHQLLDRIAESIIGFELF